MTKEHTVCIENKSNFEKDKASLKDDVQKLKEKK